MAREEKSLRICEQGHKYYKSSDCPVCPICEKEKKPGAEFLSDIGAPARRALEAADIKTILQLSKFSEKKLLTLHGMGPKAISRLRDSLRLAGLSFAEN